MIPTLQVGSGTLRAVPAIHGQASFAELVYQACRTDKTTPRAIAVELGPMIVEELKNWLIELGYDKEPGKPLPLVLGLMHRNNRIHPRYKNAAMRVQRIYGKPLEELDADILKRELDFARFGLLNASPTDSMIEAVRSAVELGIPVYGVDLEHCASGERQAVLIEASARISGDYSGYLDRNTRHHQRLGDDWVDTRRESVMASRLKYLVQEHGNVLFSCGMGHWSSLVTKLSDDSIPPSGQISQQATGKPERVLVSPTLAIKWMDAYPEVSSHYEDFRKRNGSGPTASGAVEGIFKSKCVDLVQLAEPNERSAVIDLLSMLRNSSLIGGRTTPDVSDFINHAKRMVSEHLARRILKSFIFDAVPWEKEEDWPDLQMIHPETSDGNNGVKVFMKNSSESNYLNERNTAGQQPLEVNTQNGADRNQQNESRGGGWLWVWPPIEYLATATITDAKRKSKGRTREAEVELFSGSWHEGLDTRATLRARAKGGNEVYVKAPRTRIRHTKVHEYEEPAVLLYSHKDEAKHADYRLLYAGIDHESLVKNPQRYKAITQRHGGRFIASVQMASDLPGSLFGDQGYFVWGTIYYGNPCADSLQGAEWLERSDYRCCPILEYGYIGNLADYYRHQFRVQLPLSNWHSTLLHCAIPYAHESVTVIAPAGYKPTAADKRLAQSRGVDIHIAPLHRFPSHEIEKLRNQRMVKSLDPNGIHYDETTIKQMGEKPDAYTSRLPAKLRQRIQDRYRKD